MRNCGHLSIPIQLVCLVYSGNDFTFPGPQIHLYVHVHDMQATCFIDKLVLKLARTYMYTRKCQPYSEAENCAKSIEMCVDFVITPLPAEVSNCFI